MAAKLINKSKSKADINLYSGKRAVLLPLSSINIDEEITPKVEKYYANLRSWGIFLVKEPIVEVEKPVEPEVVIEKPVEPEVIIEKPVEPEVNEEVIEKEVLEENLESEKVPNEYTESELMGKRHLELVKIAEELGLEFETKMSKKEISRIILGDS